MVDLCDSDSDLEFFEQYICELEERKTTSNNVFSLVKSFRDEEKQKDENLKFAVKKIKPPEFDGEMRFYPTFKSDFKRLMESKYGKDSYVLRESLSKQVQKDIQWVNDYGLMWERLDAKYGSTSKIVDFVLSNIKGLKPVPEGDNVRFLELINCVESGWYDLQKLNKQTEIENITVITIIEKLFPSNIMREWVSKRNQILDESQIFSELLIFLSNERKIIEYVEDGIRKPIPTSKVKVCNLIHESQCESSASNDCGDHSDVFKQFQVNQELQNKQFKECIANLTAAVTNVTKSSSQVQDNNLQYNSFQFNQKWCSLHKSKTHDLPECINFKGMDANKKSEFIRINRLCFSCLSSGHMSSNCFKRKPCNVKESSGSYCGKSHHPILHDAFYSNFPSIQQIKPVGHFNLSDCSLLPIGLVHCDAYPICTLYDSGATISLITHDLAKKLQLSGQDIELTIVKVGNVVEVIKSKIYTMTLVDYHGYKWPINVCGIDSITTDSVGVDIKKIADILEVDCNTIQRPKGRIDLLIGLDYCSMLPNVVKSKGNLQLLHNSFGFCVRGVIGTSKLHQTCHITLKINHISCSINDNFVQNNFKLSNQIEDYFTLENLGIDCNPKCGGCKCGKCSFDNVLSIREHKEMNQIIDGLMYNANCKKWFCKYPWIRDPYNLPNNFSSAFAKLKSTERRLRLLGTKYTHNYANQFVDMIERGVLLKIDLSTCLNYKGPVHYLPHHEIHKPSSLSTPLRIVFNPSASFAGHILNNYYAKGPDVLNSMLGVLLRFRLGKVGIIGDISKMYNSIGLSVMDQHTHRCLWRNMDSNKEPDHYVLTCVTFGDRPAGAIAVIALRKTAEMFECQYPDAVKIITNDSYVDDIIFSVDEADAATSLMSDIDYILKEGGFKIKEWVTTLKGNIESGSPISIANKDEDKVLGMLLNSALDHFKFQINLNFSKWSNNVRSEPNICEDEFESRFPTVLTRRLIMSQIASLYDPLGLLTPYTLQAKLLMRQIILEQRTLKDTSEELTWDIPISEQLYCKWKSYFRNMFRIRDLVFHRCVKPDSYIGKPTLVLFSDGSKNLYGACAYLRWRLLDGSFDSRLLMSRNRLAPMKQITIPRIELNGCVTSCRLRNTIEREIGIELESVIHLTDSSIVLSQILNESLRFNVFVANRLSEIQTKSKVVEWFWVSSENNVADLTTRFLNPEEMNSESVWQRGPKFLKLPFNLWPVKRIASSIEILPDLIQSHSINTCVDQIIHSNLESVIQISRYSNMDKLLRITARILKIKLMKSFKGTLINPSANDVILAEREWIRNVQLSLGSDWKRKYARLGPELNIDGLITVGSRINHWLKDDWNKSEYLLLTYNHPFTKLYIQSLHDMDHAGIETTLAKLQSKFWVPRARKIIKLIKSKCIKCRSLDKKCLDQCMGPLPEERSKPSPPFFKTSLDLFGPFLVKDTVKRRTTRKVYGIIFNCVVSRAVHLELVEGYDTQSFLVSFKRFISIRGFPGYVHSDNGSQLVAANKELREITKKWNLSEIFNYGVKQGLIWSFNKSANAPFQNGCSEALIRLVKRGILISVGNNILSYSELLSAFYEIANLLNERPIGIKPGNDLSLGSYLCPNDLILGRNNIRVPHGIFDDSDNIVKRYQFINQVVSSFWKKWQRDFFPTLIIRQKWHVKRRNVRVGDIVLVQDKDAFKGVWKLAQVAKTVYGSDDMVRNVSLRYKLNKSGSKYTGQSDSFINRSVHGLVIILPIEEQ